MAAALGVVGYSLTTVVDMAYDITLPATFLLELPTLPASYATSRSPVVRDSCQPGLRGTVLAACLLDEFLADLACELHY